MREKGSGAHGAIPGNGAWPEGRRAAGEGASEEVGVLLGGGGGRAESATVREKARGLWWSLAFSARASYAGLLKMNILEHEKTIKSRVYGRNK